MLHCSVDPAFSLLRAVKNSHLSARFLTLRDWMEADENRWLLGWVGKREELMGYKKKGPQGNQWTVITDRTARAAVYISWKGSCPASSLTFGRGCQSWRKKWGQSTASSGVGSGSWRSEEWRLFKSVIVPTYITRGWSIHGFSYHVTDIWKYGIKKRCHWGYEVWHSQIRELQSASWKCILT